MAERPKLRFDALLALALFALALAASSFTRSREFEQRLRSDEPEWIAISILHWRQFALGEPPAGAELDAPSERSDNAWTRGVQHTTFGYMNPCLPKLVWGAALHGAGFRAASPQAFQTFGKDDPNALRAAQLALQPAAATARNVVVALAALTAVLLFFVARELGRGWSAWLAGALAFALWFASPLVRNTSSYIRTDYFMLPWCLGALLLALRCPRPSVKVALAFGVLGGLALSSKLNGGLLCVTIGAWIALGFVREPTRANALRSLAALAVAGLLTCAIFWAANPRLWSEPVDGVRDMLARWDKLLAYFQDDLAPRTGVEVARTLSERVSLFVRKTLTRDDPLAPVGGVLALAGFVALGVRARRESERERALAALAFVVVFVGGTILWLPLDWERFYLTATPCLVLLEASAAAGFVGAVVARASEISSPRR